MSIYFASVPLEHGKTVQSVTLPILANCRRHNRDAHLGDGDRERTPTMGAPFASLAAAYDNAGISDNSNPAAATSTAPGESFSAQALAAGSPTALTPGDRRRSAA